MAKKVDSDAGRILRQGGSQVQERLAPVVLSTSDGGRPSNASVQVARQALADGRAGARTKGLAKATLKRSKRR